MIARIVQAFTVGQCARTFVDDFIIGGVVLSCVAMFCCVAIVAFCVFTSLSSALSASICAAMASSLCSSCAVVAALVAPAPISAMAAATDKAVCFML